MNKNEISTGVDLPVYFSSTPDIGRLIDQFEKSSPVCNGWHRLMHNDQVRYARWDNQWQDGKKYDRPENKVMPWNGSSDLRVFLTDDTINELVAILVVAFWRSVELVSGTEEKDNEQASHVKNLFRWLLGTKQKRELISEVELSAQYLLTYGRAALHPHWRREVELLLRPVTIEQIIALSANQPPGSPIANLPMMIADPEGEAAAGEVVTAMSSQLVETAFSAAFNGGEIPEGLKGYQVTKKRARQFVKDLRENGRAQMPLPYFCKNDPSIKVLKPWEEFFLPASATDIQRGPILHVVWMTEAELRAEALLGGWDAEWVEEAVKRKGKFSVWLQQDGVSFDPDIDWTLGWNTIENEDKIEIIYASYWQLDDNDDVKVQVETIFHADIKDLWAKHGPADLPHKQLPYVIGLLERPDRRIDSSRSLPERLASRQREVKVQRDAIVDRTSISVLPPVIEYDTGMDTEYVFGPAARNMVTPGREPKFMDIASTDGGKMAFELMDRINTEVDNAVGRLSADVPPSRAQTKTQMLVNTFLMMWSEAFQQQFALMQAYMPDEEYQRVTGSATPLPKGDAIARQYDFILSFDARELEMEHVMKQFEAIVKGVLPIDRENVISTGKLAKAMVRAINPVLAQEIVTGPEQGQEALLRKVKNDLLLMFTGNDPEYMMDANPSAPMQMEMAKQVIQGNRKYQQAMMEDPDFAERLKKYEESLTFNIEQEQNKMVGRTGVKQ